MIRVRLECRACRIDDAYPTRFPTSCITISASRGMTCADDTTLRTDWSTCTVVLLPTSLVRLPPTGWSLNRKTASWLSIRTPSPEPLSVGAPPTTTHERKRGGAAGRVKNWRAIVPVEFHVLRSEPLGTPRIAMDQRW